MLFCSLEAIGLSHVSTHAVGYTHLPNSTLASLTLRDSNLPLLLRHADHLANQANQPWTKHQFLCM